MDEDLKRLYVLKGRIGLVGDDDKATLSFCLPTKEDKLVYLNVDFTPEVMKMKPERFLYWLNLKIRDLHFEYVKQVRKEKNNV